ncbi:MAG TPA: hypothetical protein VHP36_08840 [Chitinispirillaceae bacterium]|nr:hypothetical protein [Chitinispirillaceae bacterium]
MFIRKVLLSVITLIAVFSSVSAYDTKGKFGMGIRIWGTPILLFSDMKIGLSNVVGLEPSVGFHQLKLKQSVDEIVDDEMDYIETEIETKYNVFMISNMFEFKIIRKERSNFLLKTGVGFWRATLNEEYEYEDDYDDDISDSFWNLQVKAGFGIEHFFTDHFGVYAGFLNAWGIFGSDNSIYDSVTMLSLGNQFAELSFNWYLK